MSAVAMSLEGSPAAKQVLAAGAAAGDAEGPSVSVVVVFYDQAVQQTFDADFALAVSGAAQAAAQALPGGGVPKTGTLRSLPVGLVSGADYSTAAVYVGNGVLIQAGSSSEEDLLAVLDQLVAAST